MESTPIDMSQIFLLYLQALDKYPTIARNKSIHAIIKHALSTYSVGEVLRTVYVDLQSKDSDSWYTEITEQCTELLRDTYTWVAVTYSAQNKVYLPIVFTTIDEYIATVFKRYTGKSTEKIMPYIEMAEHTAFLMIVLATHNAILASENSHD